MAAPHDQKGATKQRTRRRYNGPSPLSSNSGSKSWKIFAIRTKTSARVCQVMIKRCVGLSRGWVNDSSVGQAIITTAVPVSPLHSKPWSPSVYHSSKSTRNQRTSTGKSPCQYMIERGCHTHARQHGRLHTSRGQCPAGHTSGLPGSSIQGLKCYVWRCPTCSEGYSSLEILYNGPGGATMHETGGTTPTQ